MDPTMLASPPPPKKETPTPPADQTILAYSAASSQIPPTPLAAPGIPTPPVPPTVPMPPAQEPKKRAKWFYFAIGGAILLGLCCVLGIIAVFVFYNLRSNAAPVQAPVGTAVPVYLPPATILPLATNSPAATVAPVSIPPATTTAGPLVSSFSDDFSNSASGWVTQSTDAYETGYDSSGSFEIGVKQASYYVVSTNPGGIATPIKDIILNVRAEPGLGNTGRYGLVCRYQDIDNFYLAGISGKQFFIGKMVNDKLSYLTDPSWQDLPISTTDAEGYYAIGLSCIDSFIVLDVNGIGAAHVTDDEFSAGDIGLFVWAGDQAASSGYYGRARFDDFSAALP